MSDLVSRVLAAIEAREVKARAARDSDGYSVHISDADVQAFWEDNDPVVELRRCIAVRTIIHEHSAETVASLEHGAFGQEFQVCRRCAAGPNRVVYPCPTVKHLAAGYGISVEEETT